MDLHAWITQQVDAVERSIEGDCIPSDEAGPILRRCEADRRILARHRLATEWTWTFDAPCHGCGTTGDCDDPVTDQLNDCPELLDLAHAHGLTDEILAGLDQPEPISKPTPAQRRRLAALAKRQISLTPRTAIPPTLRGPNWKGRS